MRQSLDDIPTDAPGTDCPDHGPTNDDNCPKCDRAAAQRADTALATRVLNEYDAGRFWAKVNKTDECWLWTASTSKQGYGHFWIDGKVHKAHRISYEIVHGPISNGLSVCHTCDTPRCVNPAHFWLGTAADNNADRKSKNRYHTTPRYGRAPMAKLTYEIADTIRREYAEGTFNTYQLAARYGVSQSNISRVLTKKQWDADRASAWHAMTPEERKAYQTTGAHP